MKKEMYYITELKAYIDVRDVRKATIQELRDYGDYSWEGCGCKKLNEDLEDENSKWKVDPFCNAMSYDEMMKTEIDELLCVEYWDGNNWQRDFYEAECSIIDNIGECEIEELANKTPSPAYFFVYEIITEDGEKIETTQSNCSGSISPYYYVEDEE